MYHRERYGAECASVDTDLSMQATLDSCAQRCLHTPGCAYFIYGRGYKQGRCFWEHTNTSSCSEGWETDEYDFYSITSGEDDAVEIVPLGGLPVLGEIGINCFELVGGRGGAGEGTK